MSRESGARLRLIDNRLDDETLANQLRGLLGDAVEAYIHVAYLRESGVELVRSELTYFVALGRRLRVLAGGDFAQTEPNALQFFRELGGDCQVKLLSSSGVGGFHPKCYLIYAGAHATLIVGSSNFTDGGLQNNVEMNLRVDLPASDATIAAAQSIFDNLWKETPLLTDERLADYKRFWEQYHQMGAGFIYRPPEESREVMTMEEHLNPAEMQPGDLVQFNGQEGEVIQAKPMGDRWSVRLSVKGVGTQTLLSPPTQFQRLDTPLSRAKGLDFDSPVEFDLLTEATRLSLAYEYDRLVSLSNSRAKLEPYQVAAVHKVVSAWEQRFLIADDVGLGKTVEVGMVVKELKARHRADKVLILCPAGLALQWQREMSEKFDERFDILSSSDLRQWRSTRPAGEPLSVRRPLSIVSVDTAKPREDENNAPDFTEADWDVLIIDEAHKVAQHGVGQELIARYKLARDLAPFCDTVMLLSATPHDGDPNAFHSLLSLLDPLRFPDAERIKPSDLEPMMVRRSKADIRNEDGTPLFRPRWVETTEIKFTEQELTLYDEVTNYVRDGYRAATEMKETAVGFLMVLLQKRMVSSIAAIRRSLERRLLGLEHPEAAALKPSELRELKEREDDEEALTDERREQLQRKLESARLRLTKAEHQAEIKRVRKLVELASGIKVDSKAKELRQFVKGVLEKSPNEKILVFTEYTDTLDYLRDVVLKDFPPIAQIHGSMNMEERQKQEQDFAKPDVRLMVATDAAGEGLNLQFCHLMVNYELPWNPNRIEQRIGRLHRYGQEHDVRVYNLQVVNTREGYILARLLHKLETIERQLGGYAPNILGLAGSSDAVNLNRLSDLIMSAITEDASVEVTAEHIEEAVEARREMHERLESSLFMALRKFDKGKTMELIHHSSQVTPSNSDIDDFVRRYFEMHDGRIENTRHKHVVRLRTPRQLLDGKTVLEQYPQATFDKEAAFKLKSKEVQFIAFGHALLDAIIRTCRNRVPKLVGAATVKRLSAEKLGTTAGVLFNYTLRYSDAQDHTLNEEFLPIFVTASGDVDSSDSVNRLLHLEGDPVDKPGDNASIVQLATTLDELESLAQQKAAEIAQLNYERVQGERDRQADASLESVDAFQRAKADRLKGMLQSYQRRLFEGEDMDIAIRRAQYELDQLAADCDRRRQQIEAKRRIQANAPTLLNVGILVTD